MAGKKGNEMEIAVLGKIYFLAIGKSISTDHQSFSVNYHCIRGAYPRMFAFSEKSNNSYSGSPTRRRMILCSECVTDTSAVYVRDETVTIMVMRRTEIIVIIYCPIISPDNVLQMINPSLPA